MKQTAQKSARLFPNIIWIAIGVAVLFWVTDSVLDTVLYRERDLVGELLPSELRELWMRSAVTGAIVVIGFYYRSLVIARYAKRLSDSLNDIGHALSSTLDVAEMLDRAAALSATATRSDLISIVAKLDGHWATLAAHGYDQDVVGHRTQGSELEGVIRAAKMGGPFVSSDCENDDRLDREAVRAFGLKSFFTVPLLVRGEPRGIIFFGDQSARRAFNSFQIDFGTKLALTLSLALENARIFGSQKTVSDTLQEASLRIPREIDGIKVDDVYRSATEASRVGGDFYDIFELDNDHVCLLLGDISGKGIEAATLTSLIKYSIRAYANENHSPAEVLSRTNILLEKSSARGAFATVFFAIADRRSGSLVCCNAGHPPPFLINKSGVELIEMTTSPAIGAFSGSKYSENRIDFQPGSTILLYTDGVLEARRGSEFYGEERLAAAVKSLAVESPESLSEALLSEVTEFTEGELADDVAILAVTLTGQSEKN